MGDSLDEVLRDQLGVVRADQAIAAGLLRSELTALRRRTTWPRLRRGLYSPDDEPEFAHHVMAAQLALGRRAVVSHETAAALQGIALLPEPNPVLRFTLAPGGTCYRRHPGVVAYKAGLPAAHRVELGGLALTTPARTVVDLARTRPTTRGLVPLDAALHNGLVTRAQLRQTLADCAGWPGIRQARAQVEFGDDRTESPLESLARLMFHQQNLPAPEPQYVVRDGTGWWARTDFAWVDRHVIGEADGMGKYDTLAALVAEKAREDRLRDLGFEVVRFAWQDVTRAPAHTAARIRAAFERAQRRRAPLH